MEIAAKYPIGTDVTTLVHGIGGRSEYVTGTVVDYWRDRRLVVQTDYHGRLVVAPADVVDEPCGIQHP
jgi:hypothetical protein